jgi:hypothetical protein
MALCSGAFKLRDGATFIVYYLAERVRGRKAFVKVSLRVSRGKESLSCPSVP